MNEDEGEEGGDGEEGERGASATDKGLSHASLGCKKVHLWTCELTSRTMQLSSRRRSLRWSRARRYIPRGIYNDMELIDAMQTANNITKWNQVQEELKEGLDTVPPESSAATVCRMLE